MYLEKNTVWKDVYQALTVLSDWIKENFNFCFLSCILSSVHINIIVLEEKIFSFF